MTDSLSGDLAALQIDRSQRQRAARGSLKAALGVLVALGVAAGGYALGRPYVEARLFKTEVTLTEITLVSPAQAAIELTATGYVVAQSVSKVSSKVPGNVAAVKVKQSDVVRAGDVLFEIDPRDHLANIATARSDAAAARARAVAAQANLLEIQQQAVRAKTLAAEGVAPQASADELSNRAAALKEQVNAADADARAFAAVVAALGVNLKSFTVFSPIAGTVINRPPEVGEFVGPQPSGVAVDMGGVEIADFSTLMVEADVPEQRLTLIKVGSPAEIVLNAYPDQRHRGRVHEVTPRVDRAKATVLVKVAFLGEKRGALPNMSARVSFLSRELDAEAAGARAKTIVPSDALATVAGARLVYVVDDGRVYATPVSLGPAFGGGFELLRGPAPGTRVVSNPSADLAHAQQVKERARE